MAEENKRTGMDSLEMELQDVGLYNDAFLRLGTLGIQNVADLGCGTGPFVRIMTQRKQRPEVYWGVDLDMDKLEVARSRYPDWNFAYGDFFSPQIMNEIARYDGYLILNVLEYLEDDIELIASLPKGRPVVFSAPKYEDPEALRVYESAEDVKSRYSHHLDFKFLGRFINPKGKFWFMFIANTRE